MRRISLIPMLALLLAAPGSCFAEMLIANVSKQQAKEWGIDVRLKSNGPAQVWVVMEFQAEGRLKDFHHVTLEVREGGKLLVGYAPLREARSSSGKITVQFLASRDYVEKLTLRIVAGQGMNMSGYDVRLQDFVEKPEH